MTTQITPALGAGILFTQQGIGASPGYSAMDLRRSEIVGPVQEGVYAAGDYMVTQRVAGGANMSVDIAASSSAFAAVQGDSTAGQGLYVIGPHSGVINEVIATADATNPRIDQIILEVQDNVHDASGGNQARTRVLTGTPTGGTTLDTRAGIATLPGNALLLADVLVGAGVTTIPNTVIRDRRKFCRGACYDYVRSSADYTSTSTSLADIDATNLNPRIECAGLPLRISMCGSVTDSASTAVVFALLQDGVQIFTTRGLNGGGGETALAGEMLGFTFVPAVGSHRFRVQWQTIAAGTMTLKASSTTQLSFTIEELVRQNTANNTTTSG